MSRNTLLLARAARLTAACALLALLGGCAVVSIAATGAVLAADVAVGTVKVAGKVVGATVDAVTPDSKK